MFKMNPAIEVSFVLGSAMNAQREYLRDIYSSMYAPREESKLVAEMTDDERIELEDRLGI